MNRIVTIGREFGSGGRELGRRLSEIMGMAYYDKEIVTEIAKRTSMSEEYVQHIIEHRRLCPILSASDAVFILWSIPLRTSTRQSTRSSTGSS